MIINYWNGLDWKSNDVKEKIIDESESILMSRMLKRIGKKAAILSTIEIETVNKCNNDCSFCPVSKENDIRPTKKMDFALFRKIINNLADMNYEGVISLFSNNEPLIDSRIFEFLEYAVTKLPNAIHALYTNGILLTEDKYKKLISMLDYLVIDNYNNNIELNENIARIKELDIVEKNCTVKVEVRKKNQVLLNRGGLAPNNNEKASFNSPCILPFVQMVIRPDGKVSRCCQDAYGIDTLGDLKEQTIQQVWEGSKYDAYRLAMLQERRINLSYCQDCDIKGLGNYYPNYFVYEYIDQFNRFIYEKTNSGRDIMLYKVDDTEVLLKNLQRLGIEAKCTFLDKDLSLIHKKNTFFIVDKINDNIIDELQNENLKVGVDFISYHVPWSDNHSRNKKHEMLREKEKIVQASKKGKLVVYGAGNNFSIILENLKIEPVEIYDKEKDGQEMCGVIVKNPKELSNLNDNMIIWVTPNDYVEILRFLASIEISADQIVIGSRLVN